MAFVSLGTDIADVDMETGEITVQSTGTTIIRAVAASGVYADCYLKVNGSGRTSKKTDNKTL